jgi:superfamily II DNA or RNA helicase
MARQGALIVILVPGIDLLQQWADVIRSRIPRAAVATAGGNTQGAQPLGSFLLRWGAQRRRPLADAAHDSHYLIATMDTAATSRFQRVLAGAAKQSVLIVDEAHRAGARIRRRGLAIGGPYRLGLSATPDRPWDPDGRAAIEQGVGPVCFQYQLKDAIRDGYLTPYVYRPQLVSLTLYERAEYNDLSRKIQQLFATLTARYPQAGGDLRILAELASSDEFGRLQILLFQRADVLKGAQQKLDMVSQLAKDAQIRSCLVYCADEDQVAGVVKVLNAAGRSYGVFTSGRLRDEQRAVVLRDFEEGRFDFLVSIRCLDEGVDIPGAVHALILASSRTEREFVQRRGRVLRRAPGKDRSVIHDPVVIPVPLDPDGLPLADIAEAEEAILMNELNRAEIFADAAENAVEALGFLHDVRRLIAENRETVQT